MGTVMPPKRQTFTAALSGTTIALAAASLFVSGAAMAAASAADDTKVKCVGVNACKGKSECATEHNGCAGQNGCKGQGWSTLTEKECRTRGGVAQRLP
jgi:uncharacterized membrane protein